MRFEHVSRQLYAHPWAIMPPVYMTFHEAFQRHMEGVEAAEIEVLGMKMDMPLPQEYEVRERVAIINIDGALGFRLSSFEKACMGAVDYRDIRAAMDKAERDMDVDAILLNINSPGGQVTGLKETARVIQDSEKPVVAFSDSLAASAGYYLMCAADSVYATGSSDIGCIGTLMTWVDVSQAYEDAGLKRELIASGKYKGMLMPGIPLTDEQRAYLQDEVDILAEEFRVFVDANRRGVADEHMEGQTIMGEYAREANLIDEIGDFIDALTEAIELGVQTNE